MRRTLVTALAIFSVTSLIPLGAYAGEKQSDIEKGYQLSKKKCLGCHDSVANPEAGRKTRDDWHIIINIMHKKFDQKLTSEELESLINYFYTIRKGIEKDAG
jgi:hypothetical protein